MITLKTFTGSTYLVDEKENRVKRVQPSHELRRDEEWLFYSKHSPFVVGRSAFFLLEPLAPGATTTLRSTSSITEIDGSGAGETVELE
jgi:hypothetical protein